MGKQNSLLIHDVNIVSMTAADAVIKRGYVYSVDGVIEAIGPGACPAHYLAADHVIDGTDKAVLPGLINGHTHTPMSLLRGYADDLPLMTWLEKVWAVEGQMTDEDMYWCAQLSMMEMIQAGITTFADMYYGMNRIAAAVEQSGLRALLCQGIIEEAAGSDALLAETVDFAKAWQGAADNRITTLLSPHAPYTCSPSLIEKIISAAHDLDCGIHTHLAETRDEIALIKARYQTTPIQLMDDIGLFSRHVIAAHGVYVTPDEITLLRDKRVGLIHNPKSNMKLASGIAPIQTMLNEGVSVGIGTDGAASNNVLDLFEEMRFASLLQKVHLEDPTALAAYDTLRMGTSLGARAVGLEATIGTLEVGKRADVTIIDLASPHTLPLNDLISHIIYSVKAENVVYTIVDGQILLDHGYLPTLDAEKIKWHVANIQKRIL